MVMTATVRQGSSENRGWTEQPTEVPRSTRQRWGAPALDPRPQAVPTAREQAPGDMVATTRVIPAASRRGEVGEGLGRRMLVIGLGGLLLVAATLWLVVSGLAFVVVGTVLVIMVAYLAAASSRSAQLAQFATRRGTRWERLAAEESWRPSSGEAWAVERANLQRQVALLEQRNALLAERIRRLESQQWQDPIDPQQLLAAAWDTLRGAPEGRRGVSGAGANAAGRPDGAGAGRNRAHPSRSRAADSVHKL
jgi:hypothetical protein